MADHLKIGGRSIFLPFLAATPEDCLPAGVAKDIIEKESRDGQIHLLGPVSRGKMAEIMMKSDALITYSRT